MTNGGIAEMITPNIAALLMLYVVEQAGFV
jgi:hypothetical protein